MRHAAVAVLAVAAGVLAACAPLSTRFDTLVGQPADAATRALGTPTARHALPDGGQRLEYATGPYGRTTWMVDIGTDGRVRAARQVLADANLADFMARAPGLSRAEVLRELGTPGEVSRVRYPSGELWSYRYVTNDCLWFQVAIGEDGKAINAGPNIDPRCDAVSDRN